MYKFLNLNLMVTRNCNFKCKHCMRGESINESVSNEVLKKVFKPGTIIQHLQLNGGEVFSRPDVLANIINTVIQNKVTIAILEIITNGTLFTPEIESLINRLDYYLQFTNNIKRQFACAGVVIRLSYDKWHLAELEKINRENLPLYYEYAFNIERLTQSRYFGGMNEVKILANAGRAKELDEPKIAPVRLTMFYSKNATPLGEVVEISNLGVDIDGTVCNTCGEMPPLAPSVYGNLLTENLLDILARRGVQCNSESELFARYQEEVFSQAKALGMLK